MNQPPEDFDELLDQALSRYVSHEPRPGLEQRVLAHFHAQASSEATLVSPPKLQWLWKTAAFAMLAITLLLVVVVLSLKGPAPLPHVPQFANHEPVHQPLLDRKPPALAPSLARRHRRPAASTITSVPRDEVTPQERLLVDFVSRHPAHALALAKSAPTPAQPFEDKSPQPESIQLHALAIRPIEIRPIDITVKEPPSF